MKPPALRDIGEIAAIDNIRNMLPTGGDVVLGAGDDCAIVRPSADAPEDWLLTSDPVICGSHFLPDTPPAQIGHKAVGRVLSDIAAMGGTPRWALIDLVAPPDMPLTDVEAVYNGALALAARYGLAIVGGDTACSEALQLHVLAVGSVPRGRAVTRAGARPGDRLYVTGTLGGSRLGRHLTFEPRIAEGAWLRDWANAMIDVSDGLATDLRHLTNTSRTGARIDLACVPLSEEAQRMTDSSSPIDHALRDGEDFELLFTVPGARVKDFENAWKGAFALRCTPIGVVTETQGAIEAVDASGHSTPLPDKGYEHFRPTE